MPGNKKRKLADEAYGSENNVNHLEANESENLVDLEVEPLEPHDEHNPIEDKDEVDGLSDADKLGALLTAWGVTNFRDNLKRCGINYKNIKFLEEADYPLLLENNPKLGEMITFRNFHREWRNSTMEPKPEDKAIDVKDVLSRGGNIAEEISQYFSSNRHLTDQLRRKLIHLVLKEKRKFSRPELNNIADQFVMIFPGELKHVYYNKLPGKEPTGLLYKEYNKTRTKKALTKSMTDEEDAEESSDDLLSDNVRASIEFLNNKDTINEGTDETLIIDHWNTTYEYRDKKKYSNPEEYINDWLPLQKSDGYIMVEIDFVKKFGSLCAQSLKNNWDEFSFKNQNVMADGCKDPIQRKALLGAMSQDDINVKDRIMVMALHHLSYLMPSKVVTNTTWTPSIPQSKLAFCRSVKNESLIPQEMRNRTAFRVEKKIDAHPMIIEILNKANYVVAIGDTVYKCESFIDAVDVAFKIFVTLKIPFPPECHKVWIFVNELFYKLDLKQKPTAKILSMLSSYQK